LIYIFNFLYKTTIINMWQLFKNIFKKNETKILLGRGGNHGKDIKNIYANHDHCGDIICKDPKIVKNLIEKNKIINDKLINKIVYNEFK